ncbi:MAG: hypothetical protein M0Q95_18120 [Porticoccaceae bacterium]|nr:hypothetical protein [Porticoccaceae bacterium]
MNVPTEFKGKVYLYFNTKYSFIHFSESPDNPSHEYVRVGETEELHVIFSDPRAAMVESLKASIEQERAESQRRIAIMQGRIQELLALEVQS